jgi:membrane associated rhomboid family serine protease
MLILLNVCIYALQVVSLPLTYVFSLVPADILSGQNLYTLVTCMFLHADPVHLVMNMYFLYVFGSSVEEEVRPLVFLPLYFFAGILGSLGHTLVTVTIESFFISDAAYIPTLGASGAIFGTMAAYVYLMPRRRLRVWGGYGDTDRYMMGWNFIILYFGLEVLLTFVSFGSGVAHGAHVFGFVGGYVFAVLYQRLRRRRDR